MYDLCSRAFWIIRPTMSRTKARKQFRAQTLLHDMAERGIYVCAVSKAGPTLSPTPRQWKPPPSRSPGREASAAAW